MPRSKQPSHSTPREGAPTHDTESPGDSHSVGAARLGEGPAAGSVDASFFSARCLCSGRAGALGLFSGDGFTKFQAPGSSGDNKPQAVTHMSEDDRELMGSGGAEDREK
ncbi:hypothetical protein NDU88_003127 [Pleurodeles waltl]|uniref:Uncharacterized protein n=1 Tax=Pleurodeles waltl TaxID=8319 RepID=A0AAV7UD48_PLEWA|nr:hypothetical protein NDU88_003127 [Pleurodeles waltl]